MIDTIAACRVADRVVADRGLVDRNTRLQLADLVRTLAGELSTARERVTDLEAAMRHVGNAREEVLVLGREVEHLRRRHAVHQDELEAAKLALLRVAAERDGAVDAVAALHAWQTRAMPALNTGREWLKSPLGDATYNAHQQALRAFWGSK